MCGIVGYVARKQPRPSCSRACGGWNTAATTAPGWPCCDERRPASAQEEGQDRRGPGARWLRSRPPAAARHRPHPLGHARPALRRKLPSAPRPERPHRRRPQRRHRELRTRSRQQLLEAGHTFQSATDTEVLAHLIGEHYAAASRRRTGERSTRWPRPVCDALARSDRHLRHRRDLRRSSRRARRRPARLAAHRRRRRGREFPGQRRLRHRRPHPAGGLPERLRRGHPHARAVSTCQNLGTGHGQVQVSQLEFDAGSRRARRLSRISCSRKSSSSRARSRTPCAAASTTTARRPGSAG